MSTPSRQVRLIYFNQWAGGLERASAYLARVPVMDLAPLVSNRNDPALLTKARLDCDWYAANARCFTALRDESIEFLSPWIVGREGILEVAKQPREPGEERWLVTMAHQPQHFGKLAGRVFEMLARTGVRHLFYAFDEASREMPCFNEIAPHLSVLIHDESPLSESGRRLLRSGCVTMHRSWVANFAPGEATFNAAPEEKICFLGSQLGLTPHRRRQLDFLRGRYGDRLVELTDHATSVADRGKLNRYKVGFCPEGRKFTTPGMSATHTDRPFWSGCLGMVPVSEDSRAGGRLEALSAAGLIERYAHGDLESLAAACDRALACDVERRRQIFEHFNRCETIGAVVTAALKSAALPVPVTISVGV